MTDLSAADNEDLLTVHPEDQAVEAVENATYSPDTDSSVVVVEPTVITIGRGKRAEALHKMSQEQSQR